MFAIRGSHSPASSFCSWTSRRQRTTTPERGPTTARVFLSGFGIEGPGQPAQMPDCRMPDAVLTRARCRHRCRMHFSGNDNDNGLGLGLGRKTHGGPGFQRNLRVTTFRQDLTYGDPLPPSIDRLQRPWAELELGVPRAAPIDQLGLCGSIAYSVGCSSRQVMARTSSKSRSAALARDTSIAPARASMQPPVRSCPPPSC